MQRAGLRVLLLTALAMLAFAGNSILCRLALRDDAIDPASFSSLRLASGALVLTVIAWRCRRTAGIRSQGSAVSAAMLFVYAVAFSYAYVSLGTGTGALILFGFVQGTMIARGLWSGDRPPFLTWLGWAFAAAGLVWLLLPGVEAPSPGGTALMAIAGIAWGVYSLRGRKVTDALLATSGNFVLCLVPVFVLTLLTLDDANISQAGIGLAIASGAVTSGLGYVTWYAALESLSAMHAALVQLSVPAIAAAGGVLFLGEPMTSRLVVSAVLVLGGISLALFRKAA